MCPCFSADKTLRTAASSATTIAKTTNCFLQRYQTRPLHCFDPPVLHGSVRVQIRRRIFEETGCSASAGASNNMLLARCVEHPGGGALVRCDLSTGPSRVALNNRVRETIKLCPLPLLQETYNACDQALLFHPSTTVAATACARLTRDPQAANSTAGGSLAFPPHIICRGVASYLSAHC